jgi:hypothetical protein
MKCVGFRGDVVNDVPFWWIDCFMLDWKRDPRAGVSVGTTQDEKTGTLPITHIISVAAAGLGLVGEDRCCCEECGRL